MKITTRQLALCAVLTALALGLSTLENLFPVTLVIPLPGVKLGLANIVTVFALCTMGVPQAFLILIARCFLGSLFAGNLNALLFSLLGGVLALVLRSLNADKKHCALQWVLACVITAVAGMNGVKQLMVFHAPLCLAAAILLVLALHSCGKTDWKAALDACRKEVRLFAASLVTAVAAAAGYFVSNAVLSRMYDFKSYNFIVWNRDEDWFTLDRILMDFFHEFGYQNGSGIFHFGGIAAGIGLLLGEWMFFCIVRLLLRLDKLQLNDKLLVLLLVAMLAVCGVAYTYFHEYYLYFWLMNMPVAIAVMAVEIKTEDFHILGARQLLGVGLAACFEGAGILLLLLAFVPQFGLQGIWISIFTAISAFCNAGFDLFGQFGAYSSLVPYVHNYYVQAVVMFMIIAGGLGFMVWVELIQYPKKRKLSLHARVVLIFSVLLWVGGAALIGLMEWNNPATMGGLSVPSKIMASLFQSVSTRTAGMNTIDLEACGPVTKLWMSILQFIGAAPGSTGGGVKVTTIAVVILTIRSVAQGRDDCVIHDHHIESKTIYRALTIIMLGAVAALGSAVVVYYNSAEAVTVIDAIFESCSAFGTVGLSVGVTGRLNTGAKLLYMLVMFMGRVGPVSLAISLTAKPDDNKRKVMPVGHINVG